MSKYSFVAGYGWSGSSALVDLMKEYTSTIVFEDEFRLIRDPYGLEDLRFHLIDEWHDVQADHAICDFIKAMEAYNRRNVFLFGKVLRFGGGYRDKVGENFLNEVHRFLDKIVTFRYRGDWYGKYYHMSLSEYLLLKLRGRFNNKKYKYMYFSNIDAETFDKEARSFIDRLFQKQFDRNPNGMVILDQAIAPWCLSPMEHYFRGSKLIVVDRDPRDIYAGLLRRKVLIGQELADNHNPYVYVDFFNKLRENIKDLKKDPQVLCIQFEDLILNYDRTVDLVQNFLGLSDKDHKDVHKYFDPNISKKNINIYKNYLNEKEIKVLEKELQEYLVL